MSEFKRHPGFKARRVALKWHSRISGDYRADEGYLLRDVDGFQIIVYLPNYKVGTDDHEYTYRWCRMNTLQSNLDDCIVTEIKRVYSTRTTQRIVRKLNEAML